MNDEARDARIARAAEAHRDERHGRSEHAASTRARVLATHHDATRRTTLWLAAAAALVLFVGAPTAWAWSTGRLATWLGADEPTISEPEAREPAVRERAVAPVEETTTVVEPDRAPVRAQRSAELVDPTPSRAEPAPSGPEETVIHEAEEAPTDPRERRAFQRADELHTARDFDAALGAWDAYLDEYPDGRFAIEARYERALCLLRLGRHEDARAALAPFAEGRFGRYREREAQALLDALAAEPSEE